MSTSLLEHREKERIRVAKWRKDNPEKYKEGYLKNSRNNAEVHRKNAKKWNSANPKRRRHFQLRYKFGITLEDYERILQTQGNRCAVCRTDKCSTGRNFAVDHCHTTGKVRGLLCKDCNLLIGRAKDRADVLREAAAYLDKAAGES